MTTRTFYVIRFLKGYGFEDAYSKKYGGGLISSAEHTLDTVDHYNTVVEAARVISERSHGLRYNVVKVDRTTEPGTSEYKIIEKCADAQPGDWWAIRNGVAWWVDARRGSDEPAWKIGSASPPLTALFVSQSYVLHALHRLGAVSGTINPATGALQMVRVREVIGQPIVKDVLTVLP